MPHDTKKKNERKVCCLRCYLAVEFLNSAVEIQVESLSLCQLTFSVKWWTLITNTKEIISHVIWFGTGFIFTFENKENSYVEIYTLIILFFKNLKNLELSLSFSMPQKNSVFFSVIILSGSWSSWLNFPKAKLTSWANIHTELIVFILRKLHKTFLVWNINTINHIVFFFLHRFGFDASVD